MDCVHLCSLDFIDSVSSRKDQTMAAGFRDFGKSDDIPDLSVCSYLGGRMVYGSGSA